MKKLILALTLVTVTIFGYSNNLIAQSDSDCCQILNPCVVTRGESIAFTIKSPCGFGGFDFSNPVISFSHPGVSMDIDSATENELKGTLSISADVPCGTTAVEVTIKCTDKEITCPLEIVCPPTCYVTPPTINPGSSATITVENIDVDTVTKDDITIGCQGITIDSTSANSENELTVQIRVAEAECGTPARECTVNIKGEPTCSFMVNEGECCPCMLKFTGRSPNSRLGLRSWLLFAHPAKIIITSDDNCVDWLGITEEDIYIDGITVIKVISATTNQIEVQVRIPSRLSGFEPGDKEVTVTDDGCDVPGTITIK